jgi:hypothetical protein
VNNLCRELTTLPDLPFPPRHRKFLQPRELVNKSVDMIPLSVFIFLIICFQFIERTEMNGGSQQIEADYLKDNPR